MKASTHGFVVHSGQTNQTSQARVEWLVWLSQIHVSGIQLDRQGGDSPKAIGQGLESWLEKLRASCYYRGPEFGSQQSYQAVCNCL